MTGYHAPAVAIRSRRQRLLFLVLTMIAATALSAPAYADGDDAAAAAPPPSPRQSLTIGDASVVLVAANDRLYAFIDRESDNAPVVGGTVAVDLTQPKRTLTLKEASPGLYVTDDFHVGTGHVPLAVTIDTALVAGRAEADLLIPPPAAEPAAGGSKNRLFGLIAAVVSLLAAWLVVRQRGLGSRVMRRLPRHLAGGGAL